MSLTTNKVQRGVRKSTYDFFAEREATTRGEQEVIATLTSVDDGGEFPQTVGWILEISDHLRCSSLPNHRSYTFGSYKSFDADLFVPQAGVSRTVYMERLFVLVTWILELWDSHRNYTDFAQHPGHSQFDRLLHGMPASEDQRERGWPLRLTPGEERAVWENVDRMAVQRLAENRGAVPA
tara:strand:+ start:441 stop:980 length:540 start_codon:yes stop_codon:yes gene_type:complete